MSLGILWSLINPLVMMGVLVFVFTVVYPNRGIQHFPVFVLIGLLSFNHFSLCLNSMTTSLLENSQILKKTNFPRILLPLSVLLSQTLHALIQFALLLAFLVISGVPWSVHALWYPLAFVVQFAFTLGVGLLCATLCVLFRDTLYLVQSILTVLFWFSPVFYALSLVKESVPHGLYIAYLLNPLAGCIDAGRCALLGQRPPDAVAFGTAIASSLAFLVAGWVFFRRNQSLIADRL
jgi:ABC-type polysaccharide/polyol phosphate export permease